MTHTIDTADISFRPGLKPHGLVLAIALSIGLHLLFLLHLNNWYQTGWDYPASPPLRRPLHITLSAPGTRETEPRQSALPEPATVQTPDKKPPPQKGPIDRVGTEATPLHASPSKQTDTSAIKHRPVTTAQIRQSAEKIVRELPDDGEGKQEQETDSVSAILERALNKPRKEPGIYSQADGSTRVVTDGGITYCIKAPEDWRIIDPGDDMRVSMYCN